MMRLLWFLGSALDEMGSRIDDLEKSIADLMEQVRFDLAATRYGDASRVTKLCVACRQMKMVETRARIQRRQATARQKRRVNSCNSSQTREESIYR
jgi:hypothetical protein